MIEPEAAFYDLDDNMDLAEDFLKYLIRYALDNCMDDLKFLSARQQEEEKNNEGKVSTEYVAPKQDVQSISVAVTPEMYLLDGVSVLVLITASVLVSGIVILKRNPKDILSEMS